MTKLFLIIFAVAALLVTLWFKDGYIMGTAEAVLPFYDLKRYFEHTRYAWTEHPGLGSVSSIITASKPTYWLLNFIQKSGVEGYIIQATVFWFLLISSGIGITLLTRLFFPNLPLKYFLIGVLFYWFNPIFLVNVWNRFLLNYIFFFAILPVASYIFLKGLITRRFIYSLILILVLGIYSYAFSSYAFIILLWLTLLLFTILFFLVEKNLSNRIFYFEFFFLSLLFFIVTNAWWVSQMLNFAFLGSFQTISETNLFTTDTNVGILKSLSEKLGNLTDILRLINSSFYTQTAPAWVSIYNSPPLIIVHFIIIGSILFLVFSQITNPYILILGSLLFISIFLSKGTNPPLGEVYGFLFQKVQFAQIFRNPFEKFSLLIPLFSTPLFCISIYYYSKKFPKLKRLIELLFVGVVVFWGYPYFTGLIFTNTTIPPTTHSHNYQVKVPSYYEEASKWLKNQGENFRFLMLPVADEGITYIWPKGYRGADLPSTLFSTPGISFNTSVPYYYKLVPTINQLFFESEDFPKTANNLNIRFYIVRSDIDWEERGLKDPEEVKDRLDKMQAEGEVTRIIDFDQLSIWKNLNYVDSTFYTDEKESTNITYQKVNPTKYLVNIQDVEKPFLLIFSELFDQNWQARYAKGDVIKDHRLANAYANGWWIQKNGTFDIEVEFTPQKWLSAGEKISASSYIALIIVISWFFIRKKW